MVDKTSEVLDALTRASDEADRQSLISAGRAQGIKDIVGFLKSQKAMISLPEPEPVKAEPKSAKK